METKPTFSSHDDVIDSRDIIARIEELEALAEESDADEDETGELETLKAFAKKCEYGGVADWRFGATLIHKDHFEDYAKELAEEIGATKDAKWPNNYIDWGKAAEELKQGYMEVEFEGSTYYAL